MALRINKQGTCGSGKGKSDAKQKACFYYGCYSLNIMHLVGNKGRRLNSRERGAGNFKHNKR